MKRIIQLIIVALYFPTTSFSMDFFDFEGEETNPRRTLKNTLDPISHINTQLFLDFADQHTETRTAELCAGICPKIEALKTQCHPLLDALADETSEIFEEITSIYEIIDVLELINRIDVDIFESLSAQLTDLKKNNLPILQDLQEILAIISPPVRIREGSISIDAGKPATELPAPSSQEELFDFYVGSYNPKKVSVLDSPTAPL